MNNINFTEKPEQNASLELMPTGKHNYTAHAFINGHYWFNAGEYSTVQEAFEQGWENIETRMRSEIA
jgi:hypothetical protein